ncbi:hypothetical protein Tco_0293091, partial [Tanacetum coccineum]
LWEHTMMSPDHHDPIALDDMKPWKRYCFHKFTMSSCYGKDVTDIHSLSTTLEENLGLSRSHTSTIKKPILRVIHKMITYGLCKRTIGYDKVQKNDLELLSMFDARHQNGYANVAWVIARWMKKKGDGTLVCV